MYSILFLFLLFKNLKTKHKTRWRIEINQNANEAKLLGHWSCGGVAAETTVKIVETLRVLRIRDQWLTAVVDAGSEGIGAVVVMAAFTAWLFCDEDGVSWRCVAVVQCGSFPSSPISSLLYLFSFGLTLVNCLSGVWQFVWMKMGTQVELVTGLEWVGDGAATWSGWVFGNGEGRGVGSGDYVNVRSIAKFIEEKW